MIGGDIKIAVAIGLVAVIAVTIFSYRAEVANLGAERDRLKSELAITAASLEALELVTAAQEKAIIKLQTKSREQNDAKQIIRGEIRKAAVIGDGPLDDLNSYTLEQLRLYQQANQSR